MNNNKSILDVLQKEGLPTAILSFVEWLVNLLWGDAVLNFLKRIMGENILVEFFKWINNNQFWSTVIFFICVFLLFHYADFIVSLFKKTKVIFVPRNGQIYDGLWDSYCAWLEIAENVEIKGYRAILQKLESEKDGAVTNHLIKITKSSMPQLKIIGEKLLVAETNVANVVISLRDGKSKFLPENISKFYFEVVLQKDKITIGEYKGYLINSFSNLHIESMLNSPPMPKEDDRGG